MVKFTVVVWVANPLEHAAQLRSQTLNGTPPVADYCPHTDPLFLLTVVLAVLQG
jgi:hypothetical protein